MHEVNEQACKMHHKGEAKLGQPEDQSGQPLPVGTQTCDIFEALGIKGRTEFFTPYGSSKFGLSELIMLDGNKSSEWELKTSHLDRLMKIPSAGPSD